MLLGGRGGVLVNMNSGVCLGAVVGCVRACVRVCVCMCVLRGGEVGEVGQG